MTIMLIRKKIALIDLDFNWLNSLILLESNDDLINVDEMLVDENNSFTIDIDYNMSIRYFFIFI